MVDVPTASGCRIALGTAALGMRYGIAAQGDGPPRPVVASAVFREAQRQNVRIWDTAPAYGLSETRIGNFLQAAPDAAVAISTKVKLGRRSLSEIVSSIDASRQRVGGKLWAVLLHDEREFAEERDRWREVASALRSKGLAREFGVSLYSPELMADAITDPDISVIQLPGNLLDDRMFRIIQETDKPAHRSFLMVRSVFLQGLVMMNPHDGDQRVPGSGKVLRELRAHCERHSISLADFAIAYASWRFREASLVLGVRRPSEVRHAAEVTQVNSGEWGVAFSEWASWIGGRVPESVVDPRRWN